MSSLGMHPGIAKKELVWNKAEERPECAVNWETKGQHLGIEREDTGQAGVPSPRQ